MKGLAAIIFLGAALTACQQSAEVAPSPAACAIATNFWAAGDLDKNTRVIVFSEEPESFLIPISGDGWTTVDKSDAKPPAGLIEKFNRTKLVSAVKFCPDLRAWLEKSGIGHGAAKVEKVTNSKLDYDIEGVAAPVMSDDGTQALMVLSSRMRDGMVDRVIQYMRRDPSGKWAMAALHRF